MQKGLSVKGYTDQTDQRVALVNQNKEAEERVLRLLDTLAASPDIDQRWLAVGRTHVEQGFMAINRAVFRPQRVEITE